MSTTKVKLKRHFFYVEKKRTISRTYGGSNYTLAVYEILKDKSVVYIGEANACTRGHKGESSEAWTVIVNNAISPKELKALQAANKENSYNDHLEYYNYSYEDKFGIKVSQF
jgi:hypothetical protein